MSAEGEGPSGSRRTARRDPYLCLAYVTETGGGARREGVARALDISSSGIGLLLASPLPPGAEVEVQLLVLGSLCLKAVGTVVHSTPVSQDQYRIGVRFVAAPRLAEQQSKENSWRT